MHTFKSKKGIAPVVAVIITLIIVLAIGGYFLMQKSRSQEVVKSTAGDDSQITVGTSTTENEENMEDTQEIKSLIEITSSGFSPSTLTISAGATVTFINKDTRLHWPASDVHPIHTLYPESGGCIGSKFDACKGLAQEETFSFTFNQKGTWRYHDHLRPGLQGTVIVE